MDAALQASLDALSAKGVSGASEARQSAVGLKDAARVLTTVNPPRHNKAFDALLREAHQLGLRRRGDAELLLQVHGKDGKSIATNAKKTFEMTVRGALTRDIVSNPSHNYLWASLAVIVILAAASVALPIAMLYYPIIPMATRMIVWQAIKVAVFATFASSMWSALSLWSAVSSTFKKRAGRALPYARAVIATALVVAGAVTSRAAPFTFVVACSLAIVVLRAPKSRETVTRDRQ